MISAPLDGDEVLGWKITGTGTLAFEPGFLHGQLGEWEMIVDFFGPIGWLGGTDVDGGGYPTNMTDGEPMLVTTDGEGYLYLAVTGGSDYDLIGGHEEFGAYEVRVMKTGPVRTPTLTHQPRHSRGDAAG